MPIVAIHDQTVTVPFQVQAGLEDFEQELTVLGETQKITQKRPRMVDSEDASFTVRATLPWKDMAKYSDLVSRIGFDIQTGTPKGEVALSALEEHLMSSGLVSWSGLVDHAGKDIPVESWREVDPFYVRQVISELQARNLRARAEAEDTRPNDVKPSETSLKVVTPTRRQTSSRAARG